MNKQYIVYKITNQLNNKSYIGITTRSLAQRWTEHVREAFNPNSDGYNTIFKKALRKYNIDVWKKEIIDTGATNLETLKEQEKYWINFYNTYAFSDKSQGYNSTFGGDGVYSTLNNVPIDSFDIISGKRIRHYSSIVEAERDIGCRIDCIGRLNHSSGGLCFLYHELVEDLTPEELTDYVHSLYPYLVYQLDLEGNLLQIFRNTTQAAQITKCSQGNLIMACEGRRRLCQGHQWAYQKNAKEKLGKPVPELSPTGKAICQYGLNGKKIQTWINIAEASKSLNISDSHISSACQNKRQSAGGYQWRYLNDNIVELSPLYTKRPVYCNETKESFLTCNAAAKKFGYSQQTVKKSCLGEKINKPYTFIWLDELEGRDNN